MNAKEEETACEAVPNKEPVIPELTVNEPVIVELPEMISLPLTVKLPVMPTDPVST